MAEEVEVRALFWATLVSKEHGWKSVIFESDCKLLVDALQGKLKRCFHIQSIVDNCLSLLNLFDFVSFLFWLVYE